MAHRNSQLLVLQNNCKRDPESYRSEFSLQWTHYEAQMELFALKPDQKSPEFCDMVHFLSHVSKCYKDIIMPFSQGVYQLLDKHVDVLHPTVRMQLLQALMHMRHQGLIEAEALLALCFRLFQCHDKPLKAALHSFIVQDIKHANSKGRNDRLNKSVQNYMYKIIEGHHEASVKRGLSVCTELWRRQIWRDERTVNVIAAATQHQSIVVMLAALKFFLGQDLAAEVDDGDKDAEDGDDVNAPPTKTEVYRTYHKGTPTSKKKKQRKLKRVINTIKKSKRRGVANQADSFAALQLLHDPQTFAEKLFSRLQGRGLSFESRLVMMQVVSRAIGVHELQLDNFYPFMMRYVRPSQREVVAVLAAVVQACHKLVSPEALRPVLLQIVDQFVHDKARPEVMTVGLKTVRELCMRCPLVMDEALLSDLVLYKKEKDKHVKNAAKSLVALFRELKPSMLAKKERGRAADLGKELGDFGAADVKQRVDGADLLEEAIRQGKTGSESDIDESDESDQEPDEPKPRTKAQKQRVDQAKRTASSDEVEEEDNEKMAEEDSDEENEIEEEEEDEQDVEEGDSEEDDEIVDVDLEDDQAANADVVEKDDCAELETGKNTNSDSENEATIPLEQTRVLTQEDFARIRKLKVKKMVEEAMAKHGLKSANKRARIKEDLWEEMEEALLEQEAMEGASERRLDPTQLLGKRRKADKAERMASVMAGREDREAFGSSISRKKQKAGGLTNIEKQKKKALPAMAMKQQAANRKKRQVQRNNPKHHRGRASRGAWD